MVKNPIIRSNTNIKTAVESNHVEIIVKFWSGRSEIRVFRKWSLTRSRFIFSTTTETFETSRTNCALHGPIAWSKSANQTRPSAVADHYTQNDASRSKVSRLDCSLRFFTCECYWMRQITNLFLEFETVRRRNSASNSKCRVQMNNIEHAVMPFC